MPSAYQILGVAPTASDDEIKRAFREHAKKEHPDLHGGAEAARERFMELRTAYEVLIDPEQRKKHDAAPDLEMETALKARRAQLLRRHRRLRRLYE